MYALSLSLAHKLGGGVKAHGLAVNQRRTKSGGIITFEPCRHVNEQGKAGRMAFGKAIFAKPFNLAETPLGKILRIAARHHAFNKPHAKFVDNAAFAKRRHRATQTVSLCGGKACRNHGDAHGLFLKQGHAERFAEHVFQFL